MIMADPRAIERTAMVARLRLQDPHIIAALRAVQRHAFLPVEAARIAYQDEPVALGYGDATASAPHMVALMLEAAQLHAGDRVLEVGGGMGYFAAIVAEIVGATGHVDTIELDRSLAREAERRLSSQGYLSRVTVLAGDGAAERRERAALDAVIVSCAAPEILPVWKEQIRDGGRVVVPVGDRFEQILLTYTRHGGREAVQKGVACRFVPLRRAPTPHI